MAVVASVLLLRQRATPPASARAGLRSVLTQPGVTRWTVGELFAFSGWAGALVYVGALLVETYDLSIAAAGLALGFGALVYVPGNFLFRRWVDRLRPSPARRPRAVRRRHRRAARSVSAVGLGQRRALRDAVLHRRGSDARGQRARPRSGSRAASRGDGRSHGRDSDRVLRRSGCRRRRRSHSEAGACSALPSPRCSSEQRSRISCLYADPMGFDETIRAREEGPLAVRGALARDARARASGGAMRRPDGVPARPRSHRPLEAVPAAEGEDAGLHRPRGRSLPHAHDPHARDDGDLARRGAGAAAQRGSDRGDRARARHGAHAVRARRGGCARRRRAGAIRSALPSQRAVAADRALAQPHARGLRRDPHAHGRARARVARGEDRAARRPRRVHQPRHRRRRAVRASR